MRHGLTFVTAAFLAGTLPVAAHEEVDEPVISSGLPAMGNSHGIVIHRGPEVAPTPTPQKPAYDPTRPRVYVVAPTEPETRTVYVPVSRYGEARRSRGARWGFGAVYQDDNVFVRIGNTGGSKRYNPYPRRPAYDTVIIKEPAAPKGLSRP